MPYDIGLGVARNEEVTVICRDHDRCSVKFCFHKVPHKYSWAICDCDCQGEVKFCVPIEIVAVDGEVAL